MFVFSFYHGVTSDITEVLALIRILDLDELLALITRKFKIGPLFYVFVIFKKRKNWWTYFAAWLQTSKQTFNKCVTSFGFKSLIWKKCSKLSFPNWTVMPRMVEHYQLLLQQKVLLFPLGQVILSFWKLWLFSCSDI